MKKIIYLLALFVVTFGATVPVNAAPLQETGEQCFENNNVYDEYTNTIDPTIELPLGPSGSPPDDQIFPTEIGELYRLEIGGDGWNNGTTNHTDAAISWDGTTWTPLTATVACDGFTFGTPFVGHIALGVNAPTVALSGACEPDDGAMSCDLTVSFSRNSNGWGTTSGVTVGIPVTGITPGTRTAYYEETDTYTYSGGTMTDVVGLGYSFSAGCPATFGAGQGGDGSCTIQAHAYPDEIQIPCAGSATLNVTQSCHVVFKWWVGDLTYAGSNKYYLTAESETFYIRANDTPTMFADNTQVDAMDPFTYTIGLVSVTVPCQDQFTFNPVDDLISSITVGATDEDGVQASNIDAIPPLVVQEWYAIKVTSGTWRDEGIAPDRTDMEFQVTSGAVNTANYADLGTGGDGVWCQSTDATTWYVQASSVNLFLRVNNVASAFAANTGSLNVSVYHAEFERARETCEYYFDLYGAPHRDEVSGSASNGKSFAYVETAEPVAPEIPPLGVDTWSYRPLEAGAWYVLDTVEGPWVPDNTAPNNYRFDTAVNDGTGWIPLEDWTLPDCNVALDALGHRRLYFQVPAGPLEWFLRVNDTSYNNNSGYMAWNLYRAIEVDPLDPTANAWVDCWGSDSAAAGTSSYIPVKMDSGTYVIDVDGSSILSAGNAYIIEIGSGPWDDDEGDDVAGTRYDAAISKDNGVTWSPIDGSTPGMDCISITQDDRYGQIRFTVLPGEIWKIRVNDDSGDFSNNAGNLSYMLASISSITGDGTPGGIAMSPACDLPAMRPALPTDMENIGAWLNYVAQWIDFSGVAIRQFFIFCPKHIQAILGLYDQIKQKEPLASVIEAGQRMNDVRIEIESYDWDVEGVDTSIFSISSADQLEQIITSNIFITNNDDALSPWEGGDVLDVSDFDGGGTWSETSYYNTCLASFSGYIPPMLAQGVCFSSAAFRDTGASFWIQIAIDISCIFLYVRLTKRPVQELIYMLTGVRPWTKDSAEDAVEKLTEHAVARDRAIEHGADPGLVSRYWDQRKR